MNGFVTEECTSRSFAVLTFQNDSIAAARLLGSDGYLVDTAGQRLKPSDLHRNGKYFLKRAPSGESPGAVPLKRRRSDMQSVQSAFHRAKARRQGTARISGWHSGAPQGDWVLAHRLLPRCRGSDVVRYAPFFRVLTADTEEQAKQQAADCSGVVLTPTPGVGNPCSVEREASIRWAGRERLRVMGFEVGLPRDGRGSSSGLERPGNRGAEASDSSGIPSLSPGTSDDESTSDSSPPSARSSSSSSSSAPARPARPVQRQFVYYTQPHQPSTFSLAARSPAPAATPASRPARPAASPHLWVGGQCNYWPVVDGAAALEACASQRRAAEQAFSSDGRVLAACGRVAAGGGSPAALFAVLRASFVGSSVPVAPGEAPADGATARHVSCEAPGIAGRYSALLVGCGASPSGEQTLWVAGAGQRSTSFAPKPVVAVAEPAARLRAGSAAEERPSDPPGKKRARAARAPPGKRRPGAAPDSLSGDGGEEEEEGGRGAGPREGGGLAFRAACCLRVLGQSRTHLPPCTLTGLHLMRVDELNRAHIALTTNISSTGGQVVCKTIPLAPEDPSDFVETSIVTRRLQRTVFCSAYLAARDCLAVGCAGEVFFMTPSLSVQQNIRLFRSSAATVVTDGGADARAHEFYYSLRNGNVFGYDFRRGGTGARLFRQTRALVTTLQYLGDGLLLSRASDASLLLWDTRRMAGPSVVVESSRPVFLPRSTAVVVPGAGGELSPHVVYDNGGMLKAYNWRTRSPVCEWQAPANHGDSELTGMAATPLSSPGPFLWLANDGNLTAVASDLW